MTNRLPPTRVGGGDSRPNVLLVLADQLRYDVTAPEGPPVETPNIDRLGGQGMRFTRAYTPIGICSSARASLLSGVYPHTHGMLNNCHEPDAIRRNFPRDVPTFGTLLADAGYRNTYTGKWHVGADQRPEDFGFTYLGGGDGAPDDEDPAFRAYRRERGIDPADVELTETIHTNAPEPTLIAAKTNVPPEATRTYFLAERTIEALLDHRDRDGPFFHRLDFVGPHHPYVVPEPYASMYDPSDIERWANFDDPYEHKPRVQQAYLDYRGVRDLDWDTWSKAIAKYFGFVTFIDEQIGRVLDAFDERQRAETAVVVTADHGDFTGSHRQFNKGPMMYEETYHIPLVLGWPGVVGSGSVSDRFVRLFDLMPTFLEMADADVPDGIHARSLLPILRGEGPDDWPETVFAEYHGDEFGLYSQRMVRSDRFKYVFNAPDVDELYDLEDDPAEVRNLVDDPAYDQVRDELRTALRGWMERTDDMLRTWSRDALFGGADRG